MITAAKAQIQYLPNTFSIYQLRLVFFLCFSEKMHLLVYFRGALKLTHSDLC